MARYVLLEELVRRARVRSVGTYCRRCTVTPDETWHGIIVPMLIVHETSRAYLAAAARISRPTDLISGARLALPRLALACPALPC
jgi:hypothetical protein